MVVYNIIYTHVIIKKGNACDPTDIIIHTVYFSAEKPLSLQYTYILNESAGKIRQLVSYSFLWKLLPINKLFIISN